jgi:hypothetical protein
LSLAPLFESGAFSYLQSRRNSKKTSLSIEKGLMYEFELIGSTVNQQPLTLQQRLTRAQPRLTKENQTAFSTFLILQPS